MFLRKVFCNFFIAKCFKKLLLFIVLIKHGLGLDRSQPSIFSYFYSIMELVDRIMRELDDSANRETCAS